MELSRLRVATGMRYTLMNPILDELVKRGKDQDIRGYHNTGEGDLMAFLMYRNPGKAICGILVFNLHFIILRC